MEFGISFGALYADPLTYLRYSKEGEEAGYDYLFYPDSQMVYRDPFVNMAAAAQITKRVKLGTLVSPVITRHPTVLACSIYTVQELSNGRAVLGLGTGDSSVRRIGMKPMKLENFAEQVKYIQDLLRGKRFNFGMGEFGIRFAKGNVPVYTIATGPKMLKLSGMIGDGTIIMVGPALTDWAVKQVREGSEEAGYEFEKRHLFWCAFCSIHEDRKMAKMRVKPSITWFAVNFPELVKMTQVTLDDDFWKEIRKFRDNYARYDLVHSDRWEHALKDAEFVPDELVDKMTISGNPDDVVKIVKDLEKRGINRVIIRPPSTDDWFNVFNLFASYVIPEFR